MDFKNKHNLAYDIWGEAVIHDASKFSMQMNPKYGQGSMIGFGFDLGIYANITSYSLDFELEKPAIQYKDDLLLIGKVIKGQYFFKGSDDNVILYKEGDIFATTGNLLLHSRYYFQAETILLGVFGYTGILLTKLKEWNFCTQNIEQILSDPTLSSGILLSKTHQLEEMTNDLYHAISSGDRLTAYVKSMAMFHCFISDYSKHKNIKSKSYSKKQIDIIISIREFLDENLDCYYSMPKLAQMFSIGLTRMQTIFKNYYGTSPYRYHLNARLEKAHMLITNSKDNILDISLSLGFNSYDKFLKAYKSRYNCRPFEHRKNQIK